MEGNSQKGQWYWYPSMPMVRLSMVTTSTGVSSTMGRLLQLFRRLTGHRQRTVRFCTFTVTESDLAHIGKLFQ
jgi:hypothetical protein